MFEFCIGGKLTALHDFVKASFDSFRNMQNRLEEQEAGNQFSFAASYGQIESVKTKTKNFRLQ